MPRLAWIFLVLLSLLWGASFLCARVAAPVITPLTLVFLRCALAALTLHVILLGTGQKMPSDRRSLYDFTVMGLLTNVIPFGLIFYGTQTIGAGPASILNAATPIFTVLVMHFFGQNDRLTLNKAVGVILGFIGVSVMLGLQAISELGGHLIPELACLLATVSYAFSALWAQRFRGRPPVATAAGQLTMATILVLPLTLTFEDPLGLSLPAPEVIAAVIFIAVFSTAIAFILFFRIVTMAGANVQLVTFLVPVSAIFLAALILGEHLELRHWIGMAVIMAGLAAIDGRIWKWMAQK
jgi:drug/metabolite transporter (DMT)-like permease